MKHNFSRKEAAEYLGISIATLADYAHKGKGPAYAKIGAARTCRVLYQKDDLDAFINRWKVKR